MLNNSNKVWKISVEELCYISLCYNLHYSNGGMPSQSDLSLLYSIPPLSLIIMILFFGHSEA
jgi:hypothetical protein